MPPAAMDVRQIDTAVRAGELARPGSYLPVTIGDGLRASARRTPEKVAIQEGERKLTFSELVKRMDRVSTGTLNGIGLDPGEHAAIMAPNCLEFVELVCGLAEARVPPAMVNPRSSAEELAFVCNDAEARALFVHPSVAELARAATLETVEVVVELGDEYEAWLANARAEPPPVRPEEWEIFCIPYTAGTTGVPKGVLLPHRSRTLTFLAMASEYGCYGPDDRSLAIAPLYHGAGFAFALAPIFLGGFCAILPRFDPDEVLPLIEKLAITSTFMVPTHFSSVLGLGELTLSRHDFSSLKAIVSNAAPLSQAMKERIVANFGDGILFEAYGSTEGGIVSNLRPSDQLRKPHSVGLPFPLTTIRIVNEAGDEAAPGEVGELYSRSPYLFSGYWHRTDETTSDGWFSAGDLAHRDEEGYLYLVDRKDDKIISGGVNIYPREIEEILLRHPDVLEAVAFGVPDDHWGEAVRAAVVLRFGATVQPGELIEVFGAHAAGYKRPKVIDVVEQLPRNTAGKLLRRKVREPFWAERERGIS